MLKTESEVSPKSSLMDEVLKKTKQLPRLEDLIEGQVIVKEKKVVYVDIPPFGTGIIFGREYLNAKDIIKKINIGDLVTAKVVEIEGENGYIELSLKEAKQAILWDEAEKAIRHKTEFLLQIKDANKGGLLIEWQGLEGFLPASQLKPENYPRVPDGDRDKIINELQKLIGQSINVTIIAADSKENKLIFSEKVLDSKSRKQIIEKYNLGDIINGEVTGLVDFGVFIKIEEGLEGLVHISEIDWGLVENPKDFLKIGQKIKAKIIEIKDDKISLSIKALKENPWEAVKGKYNQGNQVDGVIIKYNKHGALASIEEGVAGLVHISEFENEKDLQEKLELGKTYSFTINLFDTNEQKMTLVFYPENLKEEISLEKNTSSVAPEEKNID